MDSLLGGGSHCQLSLSHLHIEIDLADCEPQAERWTLSDTQEPPEASGLVYAFLPGVAPPFWATVKDSGSSFGRPRLGPRLQPVRPVELDTHSVITFHL